MKTKILWLIATIFICATACAPEPQGNLIFTANGEDFVREGFVTKDGWAIEFNHVYVAIEDVTAYATNPPYEASETASPEGETVDLDAPQTIDLKAVDFDNAFVKVGETEAAVTQYNAISWQMPQGDEGYSIQMVGSAEKDTQSIDFTININEEFEYQCGEFVGDERKGFVTEGADGILEMTFHFDHIFGDAGAPADDSINTGAVGFEPFATLAQNGALDIDSSALATEFSADDYDTLMHTLSSLGHVGEGECAEIASN